MYTLVSAYLFLDEQFGHTTDGSRRITKVLEVICAEMARIHREAEANAFAARHSSVFKELAVISHLCRAPRFLTTDELERFEAACKNFGSAYRLAYPDHRILTVKGHIVEKHLASIARMYGTLGIFGEDGLEALHPLDSRSRIITRTMRNPKARHQASVTHSILQTHSPDVPRKKKARRSSAQVHPEPEAPEEVEREAAASESESDGEGAEITEADELRRIAERTAEAP